MVSECSFLNVLQPARRTRLSLAEVGWFHRCRIIYRLLGPRFSADLDFGGQKRQDARRKFLRLSCSRPLNGVREALYSVVRTARSCNYDGSVI
jgi:hypothetical protein